MFCENCGNRLNENDRFCQKCGARVPDQDYGNQSGMSQWDENQPDVNRQDDNWSGPNQWDETQPAMNRWDDTQPAMAGPDGSSRKGNSGNRMKIAAAVAVALVFVIAAAAAVFFWLSSREEKESREERVAEKEISEEETEEKESLLSADNSSENTESEDAERVEKNSGDSQGQYEMPEGTPTGLINNGQEVYMSDFDISASSVLEMPGYNYEEKNLADLDTSTCWAEGVEGNGVNETILFTSTEKQRVTGLVILPGYTKSSDLYDKNCAPATIRIDCGEKVLNYSFSYDDVLFDGGNLLDNIIYIDFGEPLRIDECRVTITDVREGSMSDCCISEMFLYN